MSSTILSSLGESVLYRSSLATITDNWVVVREPNSARQVVLSLDSITKVKTTKNFKGLKLPYVASAAACFLLSIATACSKEGDGAPLPFALVGFALMIGAQISRQTSLVLIADQEVVKTQFGTLPEAATLAKAIRSARQSRRRGERPAYELLLRLRLYITLLV